MTPQNAVAEAISTDVQNPKELPLHVAVIMDGNGRWARARGMPRTEGHRQGVEAVRRCVDAFSEQGVQILTLFSFSAENWTRPETEVSFLFELLKRYIRQDLDRLHAKGVRVRVIGEKAGLEEDLHDLIVEAENKTKANTRFDLVVAFNYGGQDEIVRAVKRIAEKVQCGSFTPDDITKDVIADHLDTGNLPEPDLLIRTSGEQRLSNFLLWQCAYTEFVFLPVLWPDFDEAHVSDALAVFAKRKRRFGGISS